MKPEVLAKFPAFTQQFEGRCAFMYLDVLGLVTTGVGNLIDPIETALGLPFELDGVPASRDAIATCWRYVKSRVDMCKGGGFAYGKLPENALRLSDAGIDALVVGKMGEMWKHLAARWPDIEAWPWEAQMGVLSMAWAMGPAFNFPAFAKAASDQDWSTCAAQCRMNETGNPGLHPRNLANRALFEACT